MTATFQLDGPPSRWVSKHGRPAPVVAHSGMASHEEGEGNLVVCANLIVHESRTATRFGPVAAIGVTWTFLPLGYMIAAVRSVLVGDHELVALHDDPDAWWKWRPLVYRHNVSTGMTRLGSQQELEWRWGLAEAETEKHDLAGELADLAEECIEQEVPGDEYLTRAKELIKDRAAQPSKREEANEKAERILLEHLNPQQRIDYHGWGFFFARGTINRLYKIEPGNGAEIVHEDTRETLVSLCLHPERWMPHADVALATKLMIESGVDGEKEMLEGARPTICKGRAQPTVEERYAGDVERHLLPAPLDDGAVRGRAYRGKSGGLRSADRASKSGVRGRRAAQRGRVLS